MLQPASVPCSGAAAHLWISGSSSVVGRQRQLHHQPTQSGMRRSVVLACEKPHPPTFPAQVKDHTVNTTDGAAGPDWSTRAGGVLAPGHPQPQQCCSPTASLLIGPFQAWGSYIKYEIDSNYKLRAALGPRNVKKCCCWSQFGWQAGRRLPAQSGRQSRQESHQLDGKFGPHIGLPQSSYPFLGV